MTDCPKQKGLVEFNLAQQPTDAYVVVWESMSGRGRREPDQI